MDLKKTSRLYNLEVNYEFEKKISGLRNPKYYKEIFLEIQKFMKVREKYRGAWRNTQTLFTLFKLWKFLKPPLHNENLCQHVGKSTRYFNFENFPIRCKAKDFDYVQVKINKFIINHSADKKNNNKS